MTDTPSNDTPDADGFSAADIAEAQAALDREAVATPEPAVPPAAPEAPVDPAAPAKPEATPPALAAAEDDDDIPDVHVVGDKRMVPVSVLKAMRQKAAEQSRKYAELVGQMEAWNRALQLAGQGQAPAGQPQQPEGPPDAEEDPIGALKYAMKVQQDFIEQTRRQTTEAQMMQAYQAGAQQFAATKPDFPAAYNHLIQSRANELRATPGVTDQQIAWQLRQDEMAMVQAAVQAGRNPAELAYEYARARGYVPGTAPAAPKPPVVAPAAPAQPVTPAPALAARSAASNPISGGGKAPTAELTAQSLLEMSGKEFDKNWEKFMSPGGKQSTWRN